MSKFLYLHYPEGIQSEKVISYKKRWNILFNSDSNLSEYRQTSNTALFIIGKSPNFFVDEQLNIRIKSSFKTGEQTDFIKICYLNDCIEALNDKVGSRVIWYYSDNEKLIVSSSQKAIVAFLGNFQPNKSAWTWMLSNGSLGPGLSWDERINALPADAKIIYSTITRKLKIELPEWHFSYKETNKQILKEKLNELFEKVRLDFNIGNEKTLLTLSGGYDSRAALSLLKHNKNIYTATWGIPASFKTSLTDATVARLVSKAWNTRHFEYDVQLKSDFEQNLDIFLMHGEGRNDHINSFMDGLEMWKQIAEAGYKWVVRADEAFGWIPVKTELDVRTSVAMADLSDFNNLPKSVVESLPKQIIPKYLERQLNELLEDYRDRLYQQYRLPFVIGPLQDPPLSYVEFLNPLIHPSIIDFARSLPPEMRTSKKLYAEWVNNLLPNVPYAEVPSIPEAYDIANSNANKEMFTAFLNDPEVEFLFGKPLIVFLKDQLGDSFKESAGINSKKKVMLSKFIPVWLKKQIRNKITGYKINTSSLLLRAFIIYKMQKVMKEIAFSKQN